METIAFVLAGAAALGAAALWFVDASRRGGGRDTEETARSAVPAEAPSESRDDPAETTTATADPAVDAPDDSEPLDVEVEDDEPAAAAEDAEADDAGDVAEADAEDADENPQRRQRHRSGLSLPGSQRRERRAWAEANGWEFKRTDEFLDDEWSRGAAASGAAVRDVVSGAVYGKEMHLVDLHGITVLALRRGAGSDVVVDLRRITAIPEDREGESQDLVPVTDVNGFRLFATEAGPAERFIDERVTAALEALPESVTAVWAEGDWVLAQTAKGSRQETWDEMCAPLAALADAARTLPPPMNTPKALNLEDMDPTRLMPPRQRPVLRPVEPAADEPLGEPPVLRPEEPLEMPTRLRAESRGVVEPRPVGADEVEPIADGTAEIDPENYDGTRVLRDLSDGSSIFDDLAQELGTDPLGEDRN